MENGKCKLLPFDLTILLSLISPASVSARGKLASSPVAVLDGLEQLASHRMLPLPQWAYSINIDFTSAISWREAIRRKPDYQHAAFSAEPRR